MTPEKLAKLPKWARDELSRLEADRNHYKNMVREMMPGPSEGPDPEVYINAFPHKYPLYNRACVVFRLAGGGQIKVHHSPDRKSLHVTGASDSIAVHPQASNCLDVTTRD